MTQQQDKQRPQAVHTGQAQLPAQPLIITHHNSQHQNNQETEQLEPAADNDPAASATGLQCPDLCLLRENTGEPIAKSATLSLVAICMVWCSGLDHFIGRNCEETPVNHSIRHRSRRQPATLPTSGK